MSVAAAHILFVDVPVCAPADFHANAVALVESSSPAPTVVEVSPEVWAWMTATPVDDVSTWDGERLTVGANLLLSLNCAFGVRSLRCTSPCD